ncbi:MAG: chloride channel protein [Methanoregula sp.]|jgi:CIC family chloride channel protein|nr:chloride channel protein [Methanoregula sp.]
MYRLKRLFDPYRRVIFIAIVVGIISGIGSLLFYEGLKLGSWFFMGYLLNYQMPLEGESMALISQWSAPDNIFLLLPIICTGALLSGLLITYLAPEAEGHGTDAAIKAFHADGKIRRRIPFLKAITAILTISTGGSAGREGPAAQISAGLGSMVADYFNLSPRERRLALTTGIGAGIGTIFKAPLGGAVLAAEILYVRDFESEAIIPSFLASIIGYSIFGLVEGFDPIFALIPLSWSVWQLPFFLVLGVFCALVGLFYIFFFYGTRDLFTRVFQERNLPLWLKPVSGAFIISIIVIILYFISPDMQMLGLAGIGTGYGFVQLSLFTMVPLIVLLLLPFMKILTTSLTLGSGGSGGVFAPGLTIGAATGGAVGMIFHILFPEIVPLQTVPVFCIVGMIALFGAIANAPIAVLIMVVEMMGNFSLLVPAMAGVGMSYLITGGRSIYREQVPTKAQSDAHRHEYGKRVLEQILVCEAMIEEDQVITLSPDDTVQKARTIIDQTAHTGFPVLDAGRLVGIITVCDVRRVQNGAGLSSQVRDAMSRELIVISSEDTMENAMKLMMINNIHHLPVAEPDNPDLMVGFLTRTDMMRIYSKACRFK